MQINYSLKKKVFLLKEDFFKAIYFYQQSWFKNYTLKYEHAVRIYKNVSTSACSAFKV